MTPERAHEIGNLVKLVCLQWQGVACPIPGEVAGLTLQDLKDAYAILEPEKAERGEFALCESCRAAFCDAVWRRINHILMRPEPPGDPVGEWFERKIGETTREAQD